MYGDDDTVFFLDAAKEVVKDLDPQQPYFLTGVTPSTPDNLGCIGQLMVETVSCSS